MNLPERLELLRQLDPETIPDEDLRPTLVALVGLCEELLGLVSTLSQRVERLEAEVRRLKGLPPKPKFPGGKPDPAVIRPVVDHSSEAERRQPKQREKRGKRGELRIDRTEELTCDRTTLPADAVFKGFAERVLQDLEIRAVNTLYRRERWYSPSQGPILAPWPAALARYMEGSGEGGPGPQFGPGVPAFSRLLHYAANVSQQWTHRLLQSFGVDLSRGQLSHLLTRKLETFFAEHAEVETAGLRSTPWVQLDVTGTTVNGVPHSCHVLTHPLFTSFRTTPTHDRATVVDVLRGGTERRYRLDDLALEVMEATGVGVVVREVLERLRGGPEYDPAGLDRLLARHLPRLGADTRKKVETAALIAAYRARQDGPVLSCLVCDDAATFPWVTAELALCWVHDARHYQKLRPQFELHRRRLRRFQDRYWSYYRKLRAYREDPSPAAAQRRRTEFATLFATRTGYADLDACIARTEANRDKLLLVLDHPELPLHNNAAELAARQRVRRRDVSFGPRTEAGRKAWDAFQSLIATAGQVGIRFWDYLRDRVLRAEQVPRLADVLKAKAAEGEFGASWGAPQLAAA